MGNSEASVRRRLEQIYNSESRRVFATLVRLLGNFDLAEEALHDAFAAALLQWEKQGIPSNPRAWLVSTGRFKAIDQLRRQARFDASQTEIAEQLYAQTLSDPIEDDEHIEDDRLRLIFTCCHPSLSPEAQIALTLREVCDLTTEEIASAFLTSPSTLAQRIVRAKRKIQAAHISYEVPAPAELPERLNSVLQVIYLIFNEGYSASTGTTVVRSSLAAEAIRLGRLLVELLSDSEAISLLALMLLHQSRSAARASVDGDLVVLDEQDRSLWDQSLIQEGVNLVRQAFTTGPVGPYSVQAAISAVHAEATSPDQTDWSEIVGLYDLLLTISPSPVVELNRAVAVSMRDGPEAGLRLVDGLISGNKLQGYYLLYAAQADLCRRLGQTAKAKSAYEQALTLTQQEPERRFLTQRLAAL